MSARPLKIDWPHEPIEIEDTINNALIVRDPLGAVSKIFGYSPPLDEARKRYAPCSVKDFWKFVQDIMENKFNIQLSKIYEQTLQYQDANALQMHYMQQAMIHITLNMVNLRAELEQAVKAITTPVLKDAEPMDWEWTREEPKRVENLVKDFETRAEKGKLVPKTQKRQQTKKQGKKWQAAYHHLLQKRS